MHLQAAGGLRHVAAALLINPLNMFPPHPIGWHWIFRRRRQATIGGVQQGGRDGVGVGRLGQVIDRAGFDGGDRGGDIAVTGQQNDARVLAGVTQGGDHVEPATVGQAHVQYGVGRRRLLGEGYAFGHGFGGDHLEATAFHGARQTVPQRCVIIEYEQALRPVRQILHSVLPSLGVRKR